MDEKKQEETTGVSVDTTSNDALETNISAVEAVEVETVVNEIETEPQKQVNYNWRAYAGAVLAIIVVSVGLIFVLEKEGRISTGLFTGVISRMEANKPAALVNDVKIPQSEFNSSLKQLTEMAAKQGADTSDQTALRDQAINTLVNGELLRQAAIAAGMTASAEAIEKRFNEIRDGIGGADQLAQRLVEFGVTEESLRRDIENEILIQGLFDSKVGIKDIVVSDEEINGFYESIAAGSKDIPALAEVRTQIEAQIRQEKEQQLINSYIEELRAAAKVEILI